MIPVPSQSHLTFSGLPQGSRCMGMRVLDPGRVGKKVWGMGIHDSAQILRLPQNVP